MRRSTIGALLLLTCFAGVVIARNIRWPDNKVPPVSLEDALALAKTSLNDASFYCVGASLAANYTNGDWAMHFCNKDGKQMWISVGSDKSIRKSEHPFEYS